MAPRVTSDLLLVGSLPASSTDAALRAASEFFGDLLPDVLEIGLRGRRRPRVEAYWDGCLMAMV